MSSVTGCQDSMSDDTNSCHREIGGVMDLLREGHETMENRNAGRSEDTDLIQHSLAGMKEIRQG